MEDNIERFCKVLLDFAWVGRNGNVKQFENKHEFDDDKFI
jgi:hypothetical protein